MLICQPPLHLPLLLLALGFSQHGLAINKCTDASGKVSFQDQPCSAGKQSETLNIRSSGARLQTLNIPGEDWALQFQAPKLKTLSENKHPQQYHYEATAKSGMVMSVFVENAGGKGRDKRSCGDFYWRRTAENPRIVKSTVKRIDRQHFIIASYMLELRQANSSLLQANYNIYGYKNNKCIDVHVSQLFQDPATIDLKQMIGFASSLTYSDNEQ